MTVHDIHTWLPVVRIGDLAPGEHVLSSGRWLSWAALRGQP
jgi:hypothetical protein